MDLLCETYLIDSVGAQAASYLVIQASEAVALKASNHCAID
jgi:hypothetical protein